MVQKIQKTGSVEKIELIPAIRDSKALASFMDQPLPTIAAAITGALSMGKEDAILIAGRLVQGVLKGQFMKQFGNEVTKLIEKGKIPEDYVNKKYGFQTLVELLEFIDNETIDEDRFLAIKAMFFVVNSVSTKEGEELVNYQLFRIAKKVSGSQLLLLKVSYDLYQNGGFLGGADFHSHAGWLSLMSGKLGHTVQTLTKQDEQVLLDLELITPRRYGDGSGISPANARLTDLGIKFCENIETYKKEVA